MWVCILLRGYAYCFNEVRYRHMHPLLFHAIPFYFVMWICAATAGVAAGTRCAVRAGFPPGRSATALILLAFSILVGSKLLYLAEAHWFPFDDYVPLEFRGPLHGFRIAGGIVLLAAAMPVVCRVVRLPWRLFGDTTILVAALALVFIRLGCFLNGCCFGKVSDVPWAVRFPRGSWVYYYHQLRGWVPSTAQTSLPVHPLQLYFLLAAAATGGIVLWLQRRGPSPGCVQLVFYALFFASTACLEPLRQNFLTINNWLAELAALLAAGMLVGSESLRSVAPMTEVTAERPS